MVKKTIQYRKDPDCIEGQKMLTRTEELNGWLMELSIEVADALSSDESFISERAVYAALREELTDSDIMELAK